MVASNLLLANSEIYYVLQPRPQAVKGTPNEGRAIIWHHGAGGETLLSDPQYGLVNIRDAQQTCVDAGFTVLSCDFAGAQTWGNAANQTKIAAAVAWLGNVGCRTDKVALWGTSMGFPCVARWASNNTSKVACLAGTIPVADGQWSYDNGPGLATVMDGAWSGNWVTNGKPLTDPSVIYPSLTSFPIHCWFSSDDPLVGGATALSFTDLVNGAGGNAKNTTPGPAGHGDLLIPSLSVMVRFFETGNWA